MSDLPPDFRIRPLVPLSLVAPRFGNIDSPFDELLEATGGGGGGAGAGDPFRASTKTSGGDVYLSEVAGGLILIPRTFAPALTVSAASAGTSDTHCWVTVEWSPTTYVLSAATINFGTAWPATYDSAADGETNVPIAYISGSDLVQMANSHLMMHRTLTTGGFVWLPASL